MKTQSKTTRHVLVYCVLAVYLQGSLVFANLGQTLYLNERAVPATPNLELQPQVATDDHGNSPEEATFIPTISRFVSALQTEGDVDCFKIPVPVDGILTVTVLSNAATELSVQDQDYQEVAWAASGGSVNELSVVEYLTTGTYYIQVSEMVHTEGNAYGIRTEFNPADSKVYRLPVTIYSSPQGEQGAVSHLADDAIARQDVYDIMVDLIDPESFLMTGAFVIPETFWENPDIFQGQLDDLLGDMDSWVKSSMCDGFWGAIGGFVGGYIGGKVLDWFGDNFGRTGAPFDDLDGDGMNNMTEEIHCGNKTGYNRGTRKCDENESAEKKKKDDKEDDDDDEKSHWPAPGDPVITIAIGVDDFLNDVLDTQSWLMGDATGPADSLLGNPDMVQAELDRLIEMVIAALGQGGVGAGSTSYYGEGTAYSSVRVQDEEEDGVLDVSGPEGPVNYQVVLGSYGTIAGQTDIAEASSMNEIGLGIQEDCGAAGAPLSVTVQTPMDDNAFTQPDSGSCLVRW